MLKDFDQNISTRNLHELIAAGEHENQDFKYKISDSKKIARTLSAFSNTSGGRLLIGVRDSGQIAGVKDEDDIYMIESASEVWCKPAVPVVVYAHHIEGKTVWEILVEECKDKPVCVDESDGLRAYYRDRDENFRANSVLVELWRQEALNESKSAVRFSDQERKLVDYLKTYESASVSKSAKILGLNRRKSIEVLARLIRWDVIGWERTKDGFRYFLA